jgi:site-specific recombinase XerD
MNQLAVLLPQSQALPALADAELDAARSFAEQEKAGATRRAYRSDWSIFAAWCHARGVEPLPASPEIVAAFLAAEANAGAKAATITRRAAAIRYAHRLAGHEPPTSAETVRAVMRGIRRSIGTAKDQKAPATADLIADMLKLCRDTLGGKRDRALIAGQKALPRENVR